MTRIITVQFTTDHDDTLKAMQSVIANLGRALYVTTESAVMSNEDKPNESYSFVKSHAILEVCEIDLHIASVREEAGNGKDG